MNHWYLMGGYAAYVWSAYGVVLGVLTVAMCLSRGRLKRLKKGWVDADKA